MHQSVKRVLEGSPVLSVLSEASSVSMTQVSKDRQLVSGKFTLKGSTPAGDNGEIIYLKQTSFDPADLKFISGLKTLRTISFDRGEVTIHLGG